ncbi:Bifunctional epoxide hydrolase 2 [Pseudocercospora fuligena]|uniref:Bifunctional epoxide hydrolase 2 n=1 Tax=Pseudocercospora fuligena TaxID=685502 RepID=A0A8H6VP48_9PEZI|nr:Bifunctional epoxide hydrolase 2 [Pseudocercospora fuligena]
MMVFSEHNVSYENGSKTIHYLAAGPKLGPLLIFCHGWPAIGKTWRPQLESFASLGFRVIAPDMPGYGKSTSNKVYSDYSQEKIVPGLLALLADTGRKNAVWVAHDWGSGCLWSLAATHPEVCRGVVNLAVPYRLIELGLEELMKYINREKHPESEFPYGQWSYQVFYEQNFEKATAWFDSNPEGALRAFYVKGSATNLEKPARTANVVKDGGWMGGAPKPPPKDAIPAGASTLDSLPEEDVKEFEDAMKKTGFFGGDAYYMNHKANRKWVLENSVNGGVLEMPVLFIEAKYDAVCDTYGSNATDPMKELCKNLSYASLDAGHWVQLEKPEETNALIARWLLENLPSYWPGAWSNPIAQYKK